MKLYSIKDWAKHYEASDNRKTDGPLSWVAVRTKTDGLGFRRMASQKNRSDLYAAWLLLVGLAAKQPRETRGKLVRNGRPLTPNDMEMMTGWPAKTFLDALNFFASEDQQWLEVAELSEPVRTETDNSGQNPATNITNQPTLPTLGSTAVAVPTSDSEWLSDLGKNPAYNGLSIPTEYAKMQAWCGANKKQATRRRFVNWLNRAERPMQTTAAYRAPVQDGPRGWRETLKDLYPDSTFDGAWATLPDSRKAQVLNTINA